MARKPELSEASTAIASGFGTSSGPIKAVASSPKGQSGPTGGMSGGGGIQVSHSVRQIDAYNFTQSDLDLISATNFSAGACFSIASLLGGLWLDVNKDVMFTEKLPPTAEAMQTMVNWVGAPIAVALVAMGIFYVVQRGSVIKRVKRESRQLPIEY